MSKINSTGCAKSVIAGVSFIYSRNYISSLYFCTLSRNAGEKDYLTMPAEENLSKLKVEVVMSDRRKNHNQLLAPTQIKPDAYWVLPLSHDDETMDGRRLKRRNWTSSDHGFVTSRAS